MRIMRSRDRDKQMKRDKYRDSLMIKNRDKYRRRWDRRGVTNREVILDGLMGYYEGLILWLM